jgi:outer membrane protein
MNARLTKWPVAAAAGLSLLIPTAPASAQDEEDGEDRRGRIVTIGGGPQLVPTYPGADSLEIRPMPVFDIRREGEPIQFEAPDEGWGFGLLGRDSAFNIGPAVQFQGRRREEDVGAPVGNVGFTVEAGAFTEAYLGDSFRLRAEGRRGFFGHKGWVGDLEADFIVRDGDRYIFSIGPRARFADSDYMAAYFGVTPQAAAASGLPAFAPEGGLYAAGGTAGLRFQLGGPWEAHAYGRYDRLMGDAADSPIVTSFGSRNQFSAGLGISYSFTIGGSRRR